VHNYTKHNATSMFAEFAFLCRPFKFLKKYIISLSNAIIIHSK